jgi:hypothetical protein
MRKTVLFAAAGVGLMIALASHDAQAFAPMGAMPVAPTDATTVAGGCGWGWHRGPWGGCRRNFSSGWLLLARRSAHLPLLNREPAPTALLSGAPPAPSFETARAEAASEGGRPGLGRLRPQSLPLVRPGAGIHPSVYVTIAYINTAAGRLLGGPDDC